MKTVVAQGLEPARRRARSTCARPAGPSSVTSGRWARRCCACRRQCCSANGGGPARKRRRGKKHRPRRWRRACVVRGTVARRGFAGRAAGGQPGAALPATRMDLYRAGKYQEAYRAFEDLAKKNPEQAEPAVQRRGQRVHGQAVRRGAGSVQQNAGHRRPQLAGQDELQFRQHALPPGRGAGGSGQEDQRLAQRRRALQQHARHAEASRRERRRSPQQGARGGHRVQPRRRAEAARRTAQGTAQTAKETFGQTAKEGRQTRRPKGRGQIRRKPAAEAGPESVVRAEAGPGQVVGRFHASAGWLRISRRISRTRKINTASRRPARPVSRRRRAASRIARSAERQTSRRGQRPGQTPDPAACPTRTNPGSTAIFSPSRAADRPRPRRPAANSRPPAKRPRKRAR